MLNNKKNTKPNKAEQLMYKALNRAIQADDLRIYLDYGKINRPGSPVYDPWENLLPVLTPVIIGLILILSAGVLFGLMFIIAMLMIYTSYFKKKLYHRLIERTKAYITTDYQHCQELWDFGGLVFVNAHNKKQGCVSPEGDWKDFVVQHFSDYMTDNNNQPETNADDKPAETETKTA